MPLRENPRPIESYEHTGKEVDGLLPSPSIPLPAGEGGKSDLPLSPTGRGAGGEGSGGEGHAPLDPTLLAFARELRQRQTHAESLLWMLLRDRRLAEFKFRRQHPLAPYILDFYCHEARLAIELDGGQHSEPERQARDERRSAFLKSEGIKVLRFTNREVLKETEGVLQTIYLALSQEGRE